MSRRERAAVRRSVLASMDPQRLRELQAPLYRTTPVAQFHDEAVYVGVRQCIACGAKVYGDQSEACPHE